MDSEKKIQEYENCLRAKVKKVEDELKKLDEWMYTEAQIIDSLGDPTAGGLGALLGKAKLADDLMGTYIPDVTNEIDNCTLNSVNCYKITGNILNPLARELEESFKNWNKQAAETGKKPEIIRARRVHAYFAAVNRNIIKEIFIPTNRTKYENRTDHVQKIECGARCVDGHPCKRLFWEGWRCWQHGGGRKKGSAG